MNRRAHLGIYMTRQAMRRAESSNQIVKSLAVSTVLGIEATHGSFEPQRCKNGRSSVARADNEDDVYIILPCKEIEVRIHQDQAGARSPMTCSKCLVTALVSETRRG